MLSFSSRCRYFVFGQPTDMRKSFDGLSALVLKHSDCDLMSGDIFIFLNRRCDRIKLLKWDVTGFAMYYKRLERGTFERPLFEVDKGVVSITWSDLVMLLEGIEIKGVKRRKRYRKVG